MTNMNVQDLRDYARNLSCILSGNGAKSLSNELDYLCNKLEPLKDMKIKAFADFVEKAQKPQKSSKSKTSEPLLESQEFKEARFIVTDLYENALEPDITLELIEEKIRPYEKFKVAELKIIANDMKIHNQPKRKADLVTAIIKRIQSKKNADARSGV